MTATQKTEIEKALKSNQVAVDTRSIKTGTDENGLPVFKTQYIEPPLNYKLIRLIEPYNGAVLQDLDYVEPTA
jgi:hypothetical protein